MEIKIRKNIIYNYLDESIVEKIEIKNIQEKI